LKIIYCIDTVRKEGASMSEIEVHYETPEGERGSIPVLLGGSYLSAEEFVAEFMNDHPDFVVLKIEEVL
jgi:hypothetical protein